MASLFLQSRGKAAAALVMLLAAASLAAGQGPPAQAVVVSDVVERDLPPSIRLVGNVLPEKSAIVASETSGIVAEFAAAEGQFLKTGDVICRLNDEVAALELAAARGRLGSLKAKLTELENGTRAEILQQLEAAVGEAKAMYEMWQFERQRVDELFKQNQSSAKEKNDTEMEFRAAERRFAQRTAAYDEARNGPRAEEIEAARFDVAAQDAVVRQLERDLGKAKIRAPFDGFVIAKHTEVGEWLETGGAVADMVAIDTVKIRADVPEAVVQFAQGGAPASVRIEASGEQRAATIARVIPRAAATARTFPVEIDLENGDHRILPGMFVWVLVPSGPPGKRLMVEKDAVVPRGDQKHVFVIRPGEGDQKLALPVLVETGLEIEGQIEVRSEQLHAGDLVVVRANERLLPFMPNAVIPQPAGAAAHEE